MPTRVKLLMAEPDGFSPRALEALGRFAEVRPAAGDYRSLLAGAPWADVLWVRLRHAIDRAVMDAAPRLRAIVSPTTGLNHIDADEAARRAIDIVSLKGETAFLRDIRATAELTVGLMLGLLRRIPEAVEHVRDGGWDRDRFRGNELAGLTVGLIGYGRLGTLVARYLQAFDARVIVTDPMVAPAALAPGLRMTSLEELLATAGLVSLHASYSKANEKMIGAAEFAAMRPGAWFVNTARGELVDEAALAEALRSGHLAGAAVDVLAGEQATRQGGEVPLLVDYARRHGNLVVTPHIGGCTAESMEKTELFMAGKLETLVRSWERAAVASAAVTPGVR